MRELRLQKGRYPCTDVLQYKGTQENLKKEKNMSKVAAQYVRDIAYYPMRAMLEVQFTGDENIYQYFDVPEDVWYAFKNTASMDIFFNSQIASKYRYKRTKKDKKK